MVFDIVTQLFIFREWIWTLYNVGWDIRKTFRKVCDPQGSKCQSDGQTNELDLCIRCQVR